MLLICTFLLITKLLQSLQSGFKSSCYNYVLRNLVTVVGFQSLAYFVNDLNCIKLHLTEILRFRELKSTKICCIHIHLTVNLFTSNKYWIYKLLYMFVSYYQNKVLYNSFFLIQFFFRFVDFLVLHRIHPNFNKCKLCSLIWYFRRCNSLFSEFPGCNLYTLMSSKWMYSSCRWICLDTHSV